MQITMDPAVLEAAANEQIAKAVTDALGGYEVRGAITKSLTAHVAHGLISDAIERAVREIDAGHMAQVLADQIAQTAVQATVMVMRDSFATTLLKLRGIESYHQERYARARAEILAQLAGESLPEEPPVASVAVDPDDTF